MTPELNPTSSHLNKKINESGAESNDSQNNSSGPRTSVSRLTSVCRSLSLQP